MSVALLPLATLIHGGGLDTNSCQTLRHLAAAHGPLAAARAILYECTRMAGFQLGRWERMLARGVAPPLGQARRR